MARITNASLQARIAELEAQLTLHNTVCAANKELEARVNALEARLTVASTVYREQRAKIAEYESKLATRGVITPIVNHVPRTGHNVPAHFAAARQKAMDAGISVRVGAAA